MWHTVFGIVCGIALISFIVFAFRQGLQVKNSPEGVPPEEFPPPSQL